MVNLYQGRTENISLIKETDKQIEKKRIKDLQSVINNNDISERENTFVVLYPNPADDIVNIKITNLLGFISLDIISQSGQLIYAQSKKIENIEEIVQLDISTLSSGIYYIMVQQNDYKKALKLIIK